MYNPQKYDDARRTVPATIIRQIEDLSVSLSLQWPPAGDSQYIDILRDLAACPEVDRLSNLIVQLPPALWPARDREGRFVREDVLVWAQLLAGRLVPRRIV